MMFKRNYYYLVAGLPDLLPDEGKLRDGFADLRADIMSNLHPDDEKILKILFLKFDNKNLLNLLTKNNKPFDPQGNFSLDFLETEIKEPEKILPYLRNFIINFKSENPSYPESGWENELENYFYGYLLSVKNRFLREWFALELNIGNIITALNCRQHNLPCEHELIGNNFVVSAILRSNARDFGLTQDYPEIEFLLNTWENNNMLEREKTIDLMKWQWIDDQTFFHYFTIEKILGFMLQLSIVERWMSLNSKEGEKMVSELLQKLVKSYELPDDFKLQYISRK
jgi:hypothetical protein